MCDCSVCDEEELSSSAAVAVSDEGSTSMSSGPTSPVGELASAVSEMSSDLATSMGMSSLLAAGSAGGGEELEGPEEGPGPPDPPPPANFARRLRRI